jgi:hypothetical protein
MFKLCSFVNVLHTHEPTKEVMLWFAACTRACAFSDSTDCTIKQSSRVGEQGKKFVSWFINVSSNLLFLVGLSILSHAFDLVHTDAEADIFQHKDSIPVVV